jgi:hypothetical protein
MKYCILFATLVIACMIGCGESEENDQANDSSDQTAARFIAYCPNREADTATCIIRMYDAQGEYAGGWQYAQDYSVGEKLEPGCYEAEVEQTAQYLSGDDVEVEKYQAGPKSFCVSEGESRYLSFTFIEEGEESSTLQDNNPLVYVECPDRKTDFSPCIIRLNDDQGVYFGGWQWHANYILVLEIDEGCYEAEVEQTVVNTENEETSVVEYLAGPLTFCVSENEEFYPDLDLVETE